MLSVSGFLPAGATTVGGKIDITHLRPSAIGTEVEVCATLTKVDGKKLTFQVAAQDKAGSIAEGAHIRFIVDRERFMGKLGG
jgi:predicted thioesterase